MVMDLADLKAVEKCVEKMEEMGDKFSALVNNAGAMLPPGYTKDGFEVQYQTNYLGHFALTMWMMEKQLLEDKARIVNVSSILHWFGKEMNCASLI